MKVYVHGYRGNMGRRYCKILEYLAHDWAGMDVDGPFGAFLEDEADAVIVATPTADHTARLRALAYCGKPVLVEKPVTQNLAELAELLIDLRGAGTRVQMVNQYDYLEFPRDGQGVTSYDYFKSGGDGLAWDCISIVYHANDEVKLSNTSPIWTCQINGQRLSIADMDCAYIEMIDHWLRDPRDDLTRIWDAHKKVDDLCRQKCS